MQPRLPASAAPPGAQRLRQRRPYARTIHNPSAYRLNFSSNDYLGLAADARLVRAAQSALARYGVGSGGSQYLSGYHPLHAELEAALADFTGRDRALLFGSGYQANLGVLGALVGRHSRLYLDRLAHASLIDAARLTRARWQRFRHNDASHLQQLLSGQAGSRAQPGWIVTEGIFSMGGDPAPLSELVAVARQQAAQVLVDDAHGLGVRGRAGRGSLDAAGLRQQDVPLLVATLGKSLACSGGFVAGRHDLIAAIEQLARPLIYSTAPVPAVAAAALTALRITQVEHWRRDDLQHLIQYWRNAAAERGWPVLPSTTPIQPLWLGDDASALRISEALREQGILAPAIRPPTVPAGQARLRISLTAAHRQVDLDRLIAALEPLL